MAVVAARRGLGYARVSWTFLAFALAALAVADVKISALDPWADMLRLLRGLVAPDLLAVEARSLANTVAFAVIGVGVGASVGFALALFFARLRAVRVIAAFLRSVHELFWALLLMQIWGLSPTTGVLAIALPYAGIFAKVFSEIIEEADLAAVRVLPSGTSVISAFAFARLPELAKPFGDYTRYRLECGLRSTLVLGFIGLPTIGFNLESFFRQGDYSHAAALMFGFYVLIGTRRLWARPVTVPFLLLGSLLALPSGLDGGSPIVNLARFLGHDIVPLPLRAGNLASTATWVELGNWAWHIVRHQIIPGVAQTLVLSQVALVLMAALALVLFPLVSRRFNGPVGRPLGRVLLVAVRSTPEYMIAYVLLQTLGASMLPAILALAVHNGAVVAYLLGRQADTLDYRLDAPRGTNLYLYEAVPRLYGQFLAYVLYRWEIILRESAIFGILGVATLGFYIDGAISELKMDVVVVLILATASLSMAVDAFSRRLRNTLRIGLLPTRLASVDGGQSADGHEIRRGFIAADDELARNPNTRAPPAY
jgi:phosphonate transport system permease protein